MSGSDHHGRVKALFLAACDRRPEQWAGFLDSECESDPALRRDVEALLGHHEPEAPGADEPHSTRPYGCERFAPGRVVAGRYRIVSHLGRGGTGEVYRAEDHTLGVEVALKFLRSAGAHHLERLCEEVLLAREVSHPAVCRVFEIGEAEGRTFMTMEYVDGENLASLLRRIGRLPAAKVAELAGELCAGLAAAHERGVLHRDLKPSNIMLDAAGRVRILDFGMATCAGAPGGGPLGTPAYMAPEQLERGAPVTEQTDLYALGLVLYELVSGGPVFAASNLEERRTLPGEPAPPSSRGVELDARLEEGLLRALREDPQERPVSAAEMARMLGVALPACANEEPPPPLPRESGERRHLTVLFCDLVDSSGLSQRLDPEAYVAALRRYRTCCEEAVARYDGHVAQYLGDGLVVYFGYPGAHEDDAERAVRAGLDVVRAVQTLDLAGGFQAAARVGIHTGPVVVTVSGAPERLEWLAFGLTPNVAARLQAVAAANEVLVSDATLRLVAGIFIAEDRGVPELKGIEEPIRVHRVLQPSGVRERLERAAALTPFVGREQELGTLLDRFEQIQEVHGQAVLISGEAGIGKSRLVYELRERLKEQPHGWLECRTSPYTRSSPLYPLVELLEKVLDFRKDDSSEDKLAKLERGIAQTGLDPDACVPLLADLLSIRLAVRHAPLEISPQLQRQRTLETLLAWVFAQGEKQPLVLVVEDLHWIDPSTLEWLGLLIEQCPTAGLLLLLTHRPEFEPPWPPRGYVLPVSVGRLGRRHTKDLVAAAVSGDPLSEPVVDRLAAQSDGIPLFVEELAKGYVESRPTGSASGLEVPETLQDSLTARLDRLGEAKQVAQIGAVLGREFPYALLEAAAPVQPGALRKGLARLVEAELLYRRGFPPDATYTFKHALVQDTAYESLLESRRRELHGRIADALEARFPERVAREPELIAHHCGQAARTWEAIGHYRRAGERATQRFAHPEAISHLRQALEMLGKLPESAERDREELGLQVALGPSLIAVRGYSDPELGRAYERARALCGELVDTPELVRTLIGLSLYNFIRGDAASGAELARQALTAAHRVGESFPILMAHTRLGINLFAMGQLSPALDHLEQAIRLHDPARHRSLEAAWGQGVGVSVARLIAAITLWVTGYPDRARRLHQEAIDLARKGDPFDLAQALVGDVPQLARERELARRQAEEALAIARERGFPYLVLQARLNRGWALGGASGLGEVQESLALFQKWGSKVFLSSWLRLAIELNQELGRTEDALTALETAFRISQETGARMARPELYRLKGVILSTEGSVRDAESCFHRALEIAREMKAKSWELRTATSLARLLRDERRRDEARDLLQPVYDWFTEGFDTPDLKDARALLDELA